MAEYTAQVPKITASVLLPNPATINGKVKLQVTVIEEAVIVYPSYYYSGDLYAGESSHTPYPRVPQPYHFFCGDIYAGEV